MMPMPGRALSTSRMPLVSDCARRSASSGATRSSIVLSARCAPSVLDADVSMTVPVRSSSAWMSRRRRATPSSGQDGEVERALRAPLLLGERLEGLHVVVEAQLLAEQARRRQRQARVEAALAHVLHLRRQLVASPAAAELDERARVEERHLRGDAHELREVQIEATVDVADEARVLRDAAAERGERAAEARLAERAGDRPGERRRDAGERLADVDVAPDRLGVAALGEAAARSRGAPARPTCARRRTRTRRPTRRARASRGARRSRRASTTRSRDERRAGRAPRRRPPARPSSPTTIARALCAMIESTRRPRGSTRRTSGVVTPSTTGAPRPKPALTIRSSAAPRARAVGRAREHDAGRAWPRPCAG